MTWLALLLIGLAVADLAHSTRLEPRRWVPLVAAPVAVALVALLAGAWSWVAVPLLMLAVAGWAETVRQGFGRDRAWIPLAWLGLIVVLTLAGGAGSPQVSGVVGVWAEGAPWAIAPDRLLLLVGVLLLQLSTGNVVVRLVLAASGTANPTRDGDLPPSPLKGGRILGPLERLLIVGLGLAGEPTAAAIVAAAKGLLRFPELQLRREQERIHQITEYFLVGTLLSWVFALASLALTVG